MSPVACGLHLNYKNMILLPAACGIACDVCALKEKCGGCVSGKDPDAAAVLERMNRGIGHHCAVLQCAIENQVEYCLQCDKFPCEIHYEHEIPYSKKTLDLFRDFKR